MRTYHSTKELLQNAQLPDRWTEAIAAYRKAEQTIRKTKYRIARSRRALDPSYRMPGESDEVEERPNPAGAQSAVRATVRALLASGALWPIQGSVQWNGYGSGKACCVCGKPVEQSDVEYEPNGGGRKLLGCHFACFVASYEESRTFQAG